jgi:hypothetical protein
VIYRLLIVLYYVPKTTTELGLERVEISSDFITPGTLPQRSYMPLSRVWLRDDDSNCDTGITCTVDLDTINSSTEATKATEATINSGMEVFTQDAEFEELTEAEWKEVAGDLDSSTN